MTDRPPFCLVVTNIVAPYRVDLFNTVYYSRRSFQFKVIFCGPNFQSRSWNVRRDLSFEHEILQPFIFGGDERQKQINWNLLSRILHSKPDAILASEYSFSTACAYSGSRIMGSAFGVWTDGTSHSERNRYVAQRTARKFYLRAADCVVTSCKDSSEYIQRYGVPAERIFLSVLTGDNSDISAACNQASIQTNKRNLREDLGLPQSFLFLYVGGLTRRKGVENLLYAFADVAKHNKDAHLVLVGDGPLRKELSAQAERLEITSHVMFKGFVHRKSLATIYAASDCFVFPSLEDPFGLVVGEAASAGLPLIVSVFAGAAREFVVEGKNGFLIDPLDWSVLSSRMRAVIAFSPAQMRRVRDISLERAAACSIEVAARGFSCGLTALLEARHKVAGTN